MNDPLARGEKLFRLECSFATGASAPENLPPPTVGEIAFAGRSNVGKSSLLNALVGRKALARSSNTPGRTQQINFFDLGGKAFLVDLPGYGYAKASKEKAQAWNALVTGYLKTRQTLKRVCLLIDARHGLKEIDRESMDMLDEARVPYALVMTKADKVKPQELEAHVAAAEESLRARPSAESKIYVTSSEKKEGIAELRAFLAVNFNM